MSFTVNEQDSAVKFLCFYFYVFFDAKTPLLQLASSYFCHRIVLIPVRSSIISTREMKEGGKRGERAQLRRTFRMTSTHCSPLHMVEQIDASK